MSGLLHVTTDRACSVADVDECIIGTHNCLGPNELCINRRGWFYCSCEDGFHRNRASTQCEGT